MSDYLIAPSILSADLARLGEEVATMQSNRAGFIHIDVMDNHYVPNLTFGPCVVRAMREYGIKTPLDVHLMAKPVDRLITEFAEAGAHYISFHPEASLHIDRTLQLIREVGCKAGLVYNPATSLSGLEYVLDKVDMILVMSVNPGFGGQVFIPSILSKVAAVRQLVDRCQRPIRVEVDGGIKLDNVEEIAKAGADTFVVGSALFNQGKFCLDSMRAFHAKLSELPS